jgi:Holliday junction resolvase RusA-like endonuclease
MFSVYLDITPVASPRPRVTRFVTYMPAKYTDYKALLVQAILKVKGVKKALPPVSTKERKHWVRANRYQLCIDVGQPDWRGTDVDNYAKSVMDALEESGVLHNDNQIDRLKVTRQRTPKDNGYIRFTLELLE